MEEEKISLFDRALGAIDKGLTGGNTGIPIPFKRLRTFIPNIQKKTYYLVGASTKAGKTSFVDDVFLYGAYDYYKKLKDQGELGSFELDIDYFSYEIDTDTKIIKGIIRKLWHDYGIIADVNTVLSKGQNHCSQELYDLIIGFRDYFDDLEDILTIQDMADNPTGIYHYLINKAKKHGEIVMKNINKDASGEPIMRFSHFIPNNPDRYHLFFIDHIALMLEERGFNTKQNIDKMSNYAVQLRNNFNMTPIVIQQLSFDTTNDDRYKSNRLTPTLKDFGDSKYTTRDANVIMTLFSPYSVGIEKFHQYDVARLGDSFRNLEILANRDGEPNINLGLNFIGPCGTFREMPKASEITSAHYDAASSYFNDKPKYIKENGVYIPNPKIII